MSCKTDRLYNEDNFAERDGKLYELTVEITLEEYRNLIKERVQNGKEIERLKAVVDAELDTIHKLGDDYERALEEEQELVKKARAEAIKEFADRLKVKERFITGNEEHTDIDAVYIEDIDDTLKEMVGDAE